MQSVPGKHNANKRFEDTAKDYLTNSQLRRNLHRATRTIREKRSNAVAELSDWQVLRKTGEAIKRHTMRHLDRYLCELETSVKNAGGHVHWARDAKEANSIIVDLVRKQKVREVIKMKSITTDEIGLNDALKAAGIQAIETDLAELIVQLSGDEPSHILAPSIHKNRAEIRELFRQTIGGKELSDEPEELAEAARQYLRKKFLETEVGISGVNFAVAETGTISIVESEGNGRMCTTLPRVLISVMGIEKILPKWKDLEVFMQLLPRSDAQRMNPYNSFFTGVTEQDGPEEFHLILLDNKRTNILTDTTARQTLHCIRCGACLNVCPVFKRTGGQAYHSVYSGPIGAILTPQLKGVDKQGPASLPFASTLCGACYEVCPVRINIPEVLVYLRGQVMKQRYDHQYSKQNINSEHIGLKVLAWAFMSRNRYEMAQKMARKSQKRYVRNGYIDHLPGPLKKWTQARDLQALPEQSFREWWRNQS